MAQSNLGVGINSGVTTVSDMNYSNISASETLGGLISKITFTFERFVSFEGLKVWRDLIVTPVKDFTVVAFPAGTNVDFNKLSDNGTFLTSENIEINGITGVWETKNINTKILNGPDVQDLSVLGDVMVLPYGSHTWIQMTSDTITQGHFATAGDPDSVVDWADAMSNDMCPTNQDLLEIYGINVLTKRSGAPGEFEGKIICQIGCAEKTDGYYYLINQNSNPQWVFYTPLGGYGVGDIDGTVLAVIPIGSYDIYGIVSE